MKKKKERIVRSSLHPLSATWQPPLDKEEKDQENESFIHEKINLLPCPHTIHTYIHTHMHTYIHTWTHTCIHTYMNAFIHTYIHTWMHTYIHERIHAYIHTYMNAYMHIPPPEMVDEWCAAEWSMCMLTHTCTWSLHKAYRKLSVSYLARSASLCLPLSCQCFFCSSPGYLMFCRWRRGSSYASM